MNYRTIFLGLFFIQGLIPTIAQEIKHECGLTLVRLLKPLEYYQQKYHDVSWGLNKTCLLLEKQRNRGQDGAGIATVQFDMPAGKSYMKRMRCCQDYALENLLSAITQKMRNISFKDLSDTNSLKIQCPFIGELYLGHVRYGTYAGQGMEFCQPCLYKNSVPAKCLSLAGNFNMTNADEIMQEIISLGLASSSKSDTCLVMHQISYWLDKEFEKKKRGSLSCDLVEVLRNAAAHWDGGYVFAGILGNGDAFICRDPAGIRPGYYYKDDEVFAAASERNALMNAFNVEPEQVKEIPQGYIIVIQKNGDIIFDFFTEVLPTAHCVFERIYFSRASDPDIYKERKELGKQLAPRILQLLDFDLSCVVFSYIPNTAEIAFQGLVEQLNQLIEQKNSHTKIRIEKIITKDQMLRTFIAHEAIRSDLALNIYDITRGVVSSQDTLVVIDDSIVRGTTLKDSIIKQLIRLNPAHIIVISAAPLILYPDCYGIDMSQIGNLIAFKAAVLLTQESSNQALLDEIYQECLALQKNKNNKVNPVKKLYDQFTQQELEQKIAQMVYPATSQWKGSVRIIYQTIEGLHKAIPNHTGDWYFTGNYPTPGGYKVLINSYINWYNGSEGRAY